MIVVSFSSCRGTGTGFAMRTNTNRAIEEERKSDRDIILESRTKRDEYFNFAVLPNVPGQRYTFGSAYPGGVEGEEFIFCKYKDDLVEGTHFVISVDEKGLYWIKNVASTAKTFVNFERIEEPYLLKNQDVISLVVPKSCWCAPHRNVFRVAVNNNSLEAQLKDGPSNTIPETEVSKADDAIAKPPQPQPPVVLPPMEEVLQNNLIISHILDYLPLSDIKKSRLVCKKFNEEASKTLGKKGAVRFSFKTVKTTNTYYKKSRVSTKVFRFLQEVQNTNFRGLRIKHQSTDPNSRRKIISFAPGEYGHKMLDDIKKLLNSNHVFSSLLLEGAIVNDVDFRPFCLILQKIGNRLVDLKLNESIQFLPEKMHRFPLTKLKKFSHEDEADYNGGGERSQELRRNMEILYKKWTSHLVPLFKENLEHFSCSTNLVPFYFLEFIKQEMPKLQGIRIGNSNGLTAIRSDILSLLLQIKNPLTTLRIKYWTDAREENGSLERLLAKNSKSLKHLEIELGSANDTVEITFPPLPKLEDLELKYSGKLRIGWESGLDYKKDFSSLRKLAVEPEANRPYHWYVDGDVFNSFFPEGRDGMKCETVTELRIPALKDPEMMDDERVFMKSWKIIHEKYDRYQQRVAQIREMFPKVEEVKFAKLGADVSYYPEM